ncbi:DUF418 domain-containing protein [Permianibacter sp. IMCC34836]|uniref:DUF418 domain-containing protein n=1 Tax=Permianibacter fluminis TaxID=2738515 RepID=UPI00155359AD|nr:DUF418 domain-containing protein [Permianibacter fluminis]NQD36424.1 DUF418 domain-containing protein [Permianibacter fluminis]
MTAAVSFAHPAESYSRYPSLDLIRGIAVLGILLVNIWAFSMPYAAYQNPAAYGDLHGVNFFAWWFAAVFAQEKFITLFSVLFGAGMALFFDHASARGAAAMSLHYRRLLVMLWFGMAHAYLLWFGDVLVLYAICGMLLFPLLQASQRSLLLAAGSLLLLQFALFALLWFSVSQQGSEAITESMKYWLPDADAVAQNLAIYRGGWWQQMADRVPEAWDGQASTLLFYGPRLLAQMLLGVLLYRNGFLIGQWSARRYWRIGLIGLASGLLLVIVGVQKLIDSQFSFDASLIMGNHWNSVGSLLLAAGYAGLTIGWSQRPAPGWLRSALIATGRMAFSNYLFTTIICTTIFYGHGLGWYGYRDRASLLLMTVIIWVVLVAGSVFWLRRYQQGPLEWLWRWFSYGVRPAFRRTEPQR